MKPAGFSSDDDDDDYFSMSLVSSKYERDEKKAKLIDLLTSSKSEPVHVSSDSPSNNLTFQDAAEQSDFTKMQQLIKNGVSVDESNLNEWTPLMKACSDGKHQVVKFLLENGANPNLHKELFTPLMACSTSNYTSEENRLECVRLLIDFGAEVNANDKYKTTALMMAAHKGFDTMVVELLKSPNIDVNATDKEGWNALFYAVEGKNKSIIEKLIAAGIDVNQKALRGGMDPLELAETKNCKEICTILKEFKGASYVEDEALISRGLTSFFDIIPESIIEFRNQFPDETGSGGFAKDTRDLFSGVGLENIYDKLKLNVALADFLVNPNLESIGVKFEPIREKIRKGIHRYHVAPWSANALPPIQRGANLTMEDCIQSVSNVLKHLVITYATLEYVKNRIILRQDKECPPFYQEITDSLIGCHGEIKEIQLLLANLHKIANTVKEVKEVEADIIEDRKRNSSKGWTAFSAKVVIAWLIICIYTNFRLS